MTLIRRLSSVPLDIPVVAVDRPSSGIADDLPAERAATLLLYEQLRRERIDADHGEERSQAKRRYH